MRLRIECSQGSHGHFLKPEEIVHSICSKDSVTQKKKKSHENDAVREINTHFEDPLIRTA